MKSCRYFFRNVGLTLTVLLVLHASTNVKAQSQSYGLDHQEQSLSILTGIDYSILPVTISYQRGDSLLGYKYPFQTSIGITTPLFNPDLGDIRLKPTIGTTLFRRNHFAIAGQFSLIYLNTKMQTLTSNSFGIEAGFYLGTTAKKLDFGIEFLLAKMLYSNIHHSDKYRDNVYEDVVDGWYQSTAANLQIGTRLSYETGQFNILFHAGISRTAEFNTYLFVPSFYSSIGLGYRF